MSYSLDVDTFRFARFAEKVWGVDGAFYDSRQAALEGIFRTKAFFKSLGLPLSFTDAGLPVNQIPELAKRTVFFGDKGRFKKLTAGDVEAILTAVV